MNLGNGFAWDAAIEKFRFLGKIPIKEIYSAQVKSFEVHRMDEGFLRSKPYERAWREGKRLFLDFHAFLFVQGDIFLDGVSPESTVIEAIHGRGLPEYILGIRYRDFDKLSRLDLILWKPPKKITLLHEVIQRLKDEAASELASEISAVDEETHCPKLFPENFFDGRAYRLKFSCERVSSQPSGIPEGYGLIECMFGNLSVCGYTDEKSFLNGTRKSVECEYVNLTYSSGWDRHSVLYSMGMQLLNISFVNDYLVDAHMNFYVPKAILPKLMHLFTPKRRR